MSTNPFTAIANARIFDGENITDHSCVLIHDGTIVNVGTHPPADIDVFDANGGTLLPGLIDAHTHTEPEFLRIALTFGVTTELEMQGFWSPEQSAYVDEHDDVADVRSAGLGITPPGGHPHELIPPQVNQRPGEERQFPYATSPQRAAEIVAERVAQGSDYIKVFVEDGRVFDKPGTPVLRDDILRAAVRAAHEHDKIVLAHTLTADAAQRAIAAGVDGLAHVFLDQGATPELIDVIVRSGAFVIATTVTCASILGHTGAALAADPRVATRLDETWLGTLRGSIDTFHDSSLDTVLNTVAALHRAGVDILAGTDVSHPVEYVGGTAHGASLHEELQLLVRAGLSPVEALRSATSVTARRFGLTDRGRVVNGARADLLLVKGDPTADISDTLNIEAVWRRGVRLH
ncbi:amidohydrolase family protein [Mycobacterium lentiflavum]|uniref:Amidohydrolase family protein n=1 Tax=Mycobacterium lentiflavum TaxID=141349 RepID=A0ABY3UW36_MYCLN|nr:amidohydrolase family protein [Mycobacterium lentiflavum]ULP41608.1 amidohydrolase family protein [Mycobacterium lentiflavum]